MGEGLWYGAVGALAGLVGGMFGLGGGVVLVPALFLLYAWQGFPSQVIPIVAVATSMATIAVTAAASAWAHWRLGSLDWRVTRLLLPGVVLGSVVGSWLAGNLPVSWFQSLFAAYLIAVAWRLLRPQPNSSQVRLPPKPFLMTGVGGGIGMLSAMLGIGGGTLTVPFLVRCSFPMQVAVAVSSALGLPIALAGTLSYILLGWDASNLPRDSLGYVYLPAFFGIVVTSMVTAPVGAWLAHRLPTDFLKRGFALILMLMAFRILYGR
ncbi:MAG: sulfite exporter TauE/SafE family protein [Methylohalobius sp.]|nr:sulfite exporter TauE/SafE family protein [Methylohalobius sp.]